MMSLRRVHSGHMGNRSFWRRVRAFRKVLSSKSGEGLSYWQEEPIHRLQPTAVRASICCRRG